MESKFIITKTVHFPNSDFQYSEKPRIYFITRCSKDIETPEPPPPNFNKMNIDELKLLYGMLGEFILNEEKEGLV